MSDQHIDKNQSQELVPPLKDEMEIDLMEILR